MRAKLLLYANRKADTETAAQAVRCARTAQAVRPVRVGSFAVNHSGELPLRAAGAQEGRQPAVFHPLVNLPFSLKGLGADGRLRKQEKGNDRGFLLPRGITPFRISAAVLLHPVWVCAGAAQGELPEGQERVPWGISVPRNSFTGAGYLNPAVVADLHLKTACAALLCRALLEVNRMCSSTVSDTANRLRKTRKKKSSAVLLFLLTQSTICTQALEGKVGVQRGRETMGVPSFLLPRRVPQLPRRVPQSPPGSGEPFTRFGHTAKPVPATASLSSKTPFAFPHRRAIIDT